jgi:hypothetical protein
LREHALAIGGADAARSVHESANLHEPPAVRIDAERVGRSAGWNGYPESEPENDSASQDCGNASAASWRSNASLRTRRS